MIQAGDLRTLATFKVPTVAETYGATTLEPFNEDFRAWVQIQPLSGNEETVAGQLQRSRSSLVTARYDARIREGLRMIARGRTFEIQSVLTLDERDAEMQLTCRELV